MFPRPCDSTMRTADCTKRVTPQAGRGGTVPGFLLLVILCFCLTAWAWASTGPVQPDAIPRRIRCPDPLVWNAMYLYLRMAGVVWIAAEWIAAVVLWRTYRLLLRHF
jgi:hypothetical protein